MLFKIAETARCWECFSKKLASSAWCCTRWWNSVTDLLRSQSLNPAIFVCLLRLTLLLGAWISLLSR